jgi:hypothetical protein
MQKTHVKPHTKFWAWSCGTKDLDEECQTAMRRYEQRYQQRPLLLLCHEDVTLAPVADLEILPADFVPANALYFAVPERQQRGVAAR